MAMSNEQVLREVESLVEAVKQCFGMVIGVIAKTTAPDQALRNLMEYHQAYSIEFGGNGWRDRVVRKMEIAAALAVRRSGTNDEALRSLVDALLTPQSDPDQIH